MDAGKRKKNNKLSISSMRARLKCSENGINPGFSANESSSKEDAKPQNDDQDDDFRNTSKTKSPNVPSGQPQEMKSPSEKQITEIPTGEVTSPLKDFCPICQVPLQFIKIPPELHTAHCLIDFDNLPDCPDGVECLNTNMFHYRDYNHQMLASWRCSANYIPPDVNFPTAKASAKKRPSLSPLSLSSKKKLPKKDVEERNPDDPPAIAVKKALFAEDASTSVPKAPVKLENTTEEVAQCAKNFNDEDEIDLNETFLNDLCDKYIPDPPPQEADRRCKVKPAKCDVVIEYNGIQNQQSNPWISNKQNACSVTCLADNVEELKINCTISIKSTDFKPRIAASQSPVHVNLLFNETGWEALQVDGSPTSKVTDMDVSLCKCSRAMTVKCSVTDPKISPVTSLANNIDVALTNKYSAVLHELGLKRKTEAGSDPEKKSRSSHEKVNVLKNKNSQISIKSFFKPEGGQEPKVESSEVPENTVEPSTSSVPLKTPSAPKQNVRPKTPMFLLAGSSSSRPMTPIALETDGPSKPRKWGNQTGAVPQYKRIEGTPFVVDAFQYGSIPGVSAYFLSHFHSDHYMGLSKNFRHPLYCSKISANLIQLKFKVDPQYLHILEVGTPRVLQNVEIDVHDANHCPGSLMIVFRLLDGRTILHVGDFRASTSMEQFSRLRDVDVLYLDTTYLDPAYDFPSQEAIVKEVISYGHKHCTLNPRTLFVCGSYTIGKEKVFLGLAEALDCKIWASKEKTKVFSCLDNEAISKRLCSDCRQAQIHVVFMRDINHQSLENILKEAGSHYTSLVAFKPTGWTTSKVGSPSTFKKSTKGNITIYDVPYSEHSSFSELRRFVRFVRPKRVQVTVNLTKQKFYQKYFKEWLQTNGGDQASLDGFLNKDSV